MQHRVHVGRVSVVVFVLAASTSAVAGSVSVAAGATPTWAAGGQAQALTGRPAPTPAVWVPGVAPHLFGQLTSGLSTNWAGIIDSGSDFTGVSGQWTVPTVTATASDQYSSSWIGVDGSTNQWLLQAGTEQDSLDGSTEYYAWYEVITPGNSAPEQLIGLVSPGDHMVASISEQSAGNWTVSIADATSAQSTVEPVAYGGPGSSAEWIEEAPSAGGSSPLPLANFGAVTFSGIGASASDPATANLNAVSMVDSAGDVIAYPGNVSGSSFLITYRAPPVSAPSDHGYWLVGGDGGIFSFGAAQFYGSTGSLDLQRAVVGITPTANDGGYWLVAADGGIFSFGDTAFYGSVPGLGLAPAGTPGPGKRLNAPIVGVVPSSDGGGYFMVASDGGVFAFGDARYEGSCPGIGGCAGAAVAVMPDASGNGYWVVTATGNVYSFGDAQYDGAPGPKDVPVTAAVRTPDGGGYWILFANGSLCSYGDAAYYGGLASGEAPSIDPATSVFTDDGSHGYWIATANGAVYPFGQAPNDGGMSQLAMNAPVIAGTGW